jgi:glutamine synthetase
MVAAFERERATSMTHEDVLKRVGAEDIHLIDLVFSDIAGGAKAMTIPVSLLPQTLERGYRFDGSALMGGMRKVELDLYLAPDPSTLMIFPPEEGHRRRGRLCCSVLRRDGLPFDGDPRSVLERALQAARDLGFDYHVGIEMEFYLVRGDWTEPMPARDAAGYFDVGEDVVSRTRDGVLTTLQEIGVAVGGAHHETGPGQEEIDLIGTDALQMADHLITVRQVIRSVAQRSGLRASFMPKPFADAPGSGLHMFQRLRRFPDNTDALKNVDDSLSTVAYKMIAGQLNHAAGMCAVLCPTVNSYKRLNAGHRAPRHATWAHVSQSSLIRVPSWGSGEEAAIELRCPDSMANPYLAMAVALSAAMSGIKSGEEPPDPLEESFSAYDDEGMQRIGVPRLPGTLGEAIQAMTQDQLVQDALGSYVYDQLLTVKQTEWEEYRAHVSPWEHRRYGDV